MTLEHSDTNFYQNTAIMKRLSVFIHLFEIMEHEEKQSKQRVENRLQIFRNNNDVPFITEKLNMLIFFLFTKTVNYNTIYFYTVPLYLDLYGLIINTPTVVLIITFQFLHSMCVCLRHQYRTDIGTRAHSSNSEWVSPNTQYYILSILFFIRLETFFIFLTDMFRFACR